MRNWLFNCCLLLVFVNMEKKNTSKHAEKVELATNNNPSDKNGVMNSSAGNVPCLTAAKRPLDSCKEGMKTLCIVW